MTGKKKIIIAAIVLACLGALAVPAVIGIDLYIDHKVPNVAKSTELYITPGMTKADVYQRLIDSSAVIRPRSLERAFKDIDSLKVGHYTLTPENTSVYIGRMLTFGWQSPVKLVLSGAMRRVGDIARKIGAQMLVDSSQAAAALQDSALLAGLGFTRETMFALIMPATYEVYWTEGMPEILGRQKKAYDAFWTSENKAKAQTLGLSQMQVSTLASIVKGESNFTAELPRIAGVYLTRLRIGMKLQADPTIAYCFDYKLNRILRKHLSVESPFNTYRYAGLPPSPICVPPKEYLEAVLNPQSDGELYFCANPLFNGSHLFARTYSEHLRNARAFQKALTIRQRKTNTKTSF